MSRDKSFEWRMEGMTTSYMIVATAKQEGRDPVDALRQEIRYRKRSGVNVPTMTKREMEQAEHDMQVFTIHTILAVALMILWEEHNFRHAALNRFAKRFNVYADALLSGSINWEDILDCLREECDIYLDKEEFFRDTRKRS